MGISCVLCGRFLCSYWADVSLETTPCYLTATVNAVYVTINESLIYLVVILLQYACSLTLIPAKLYWVEDQGAFMTSEQQQSPESRKLSTKLIVTNLISALHSIIIALAMR